MGMRLKKTRVMLHALAMGSCLVFYVVVVVVVVIAEKTGMRNVCKLVHTRPGLDNFCMWICTW